MPRPTSPIRPFRSFLRFEELERRDVPSTTLFTDDFNRPNSLTLEPDWTTFIGAVGVSGNASSTTGNPNLVVVNNVGSADTAVQADVNVPNNGQTAALVARYNGPSNSYFYAYLQNFGNTPYAGIGASVNGRNFNLSQKQVATTSGNLRFELLGAELKVFLNDTLVTFASNNTLASGGVGMLLLGANVTVDNFLVEDIAPTVPPTLPFADDFNTTVRGQLNSENWATSGLPIQVNGGIAAAVGIGTAVLRGINEADMVVQADVNVASSGQASQLLARHGANGAYIADLYNLNGTAYARLYSTSGFLGQAAVGSTSGTLRLEVVGSSQKVFFNNTLVFSANDTALVSGTVGIISYNGGTFDNFSAVKISKPTASLPFSENFTTAVNGQLGGEWTSQIGLIDVDTNAGTAVGQANVISIATLNGINESNVALQADVTASANFFTGGLVARYSGPGNSNYYMADLFNYNGKGYVQLYKNLGGAYSLLGQTLVNATSGTLRFEVVGNSLKAFFNGTLALFANDLALTTGTVGLWSDSNATFDNLTTDRITTVPQTLPFAEDFENPVNSQLDNTKWANLGAVNVANGTVTSTAPTTSAIANVIGVNQANVIVQADVTVAVGQYGGVIARSNGVGSYYQADLVNSNGTTYAEIWRLLNGQSTRLAYQSVASNTGTLRFEVSGTSLKLFFNDTLATYANDSALTTGTVGIYLFQGTVDNFSATDYITVPQTLPFSENFNTPVNQGLNGVAWTNQEGLFQVVAGVAFGGNGYNIATVNGLTAANTSAQVNVTTLGNGRTGGVVVRYTDSRNYYYADLVNAGVSGYVRIVRVFNGQHTILNLVPVGSTSGTLKLEAFGSSLFALFNGNLVANATDTALASGSVGIFSYYGTELDNFVAL